MPRLLPTRIDPRKAAEVYVAGRARAIPLEEKRRLVARDVEAPPPGFERVDAVPERAPRYGVAVPERLDFHRGAGTWRDRLAPRPAGSR